MKPVRGASAEEHLVCVVVRESEVSGVADYLDYLRERTLADRIVIVVPEAVPPFSAVAESDTLRVALPDDEAVPAVVLRACAGEHADIAFIRVGVRVPVGWDSVLAAAAKRCARATIVSPRSNRLPAFAVEESAMEAGDLLAINEWLQREYAVTSRDVPRFLDTCGLISGLVTDAESLTHCDDSDFMIRLRRSGAVTLVCDTLFVDDKEVADIPRPFLDRKALRELQSVAALQRDSHSARLHVSHSWGGGVERWIRDFAHEDGGVSFVLRSAGTRSAFGQHLELYRADFPETPILAWSLCMPIEVTAASHAQYREILAGIVDAFGIEAIIVSSLIGHSLDVLTLDVPTAVVTHDYFPWCAGIVLHFGDVCHSCDRTRLGFCLDANEWHPFRGMTNSDEWLALRDRYLDLLASDHVRLIAPDESVRQHLTTVDARFSALDWSIVPHGADLAPKALSAWAGASPEEANEALSRPLRVVVLGRLNPHKGQSVFRLLAESLGAEVAFILLGCGPYGLEFERLPSVERVVPDFQQSELEGLLRETAPDCGLLLSVWPETFSYTLSELRAFGIPPVATDFGAFGSRIHDNEDGFLCDPAPAEVKRVLLGLREAPGRLAAVAARLRMLPVRSVADMVADYEAVLPQRGSRRSRDGNTVDVMLDGVVGNVSLLNCFGVLDAQAKGRGNAVAELRQALASRELQLDEARRIIAGLEAQVQAKYDEAHSLGQDLRQVDARRVAAESQLEAVYASTFWVLTKPLRAGVQGLRRLRGIVFPLIRVVLRELRHPRRFAIKLFDAARQPNWGGLRRLGGSEGKAGAVPETQIAGASAVTVSDAYRDFTNDEVPPARIRAIAFYLPQFHPIPENDEWWGKGFTEWTNVARALPQFVGHYQPHLPGELGFYDLRVPDVQRRQMALARHFGIHGFCYYYYWFSGRKLLERPLAQHVADPKMDLPFCICWANENWTRRWDGKEADVLMAQRYDESDAEAFIRDVAPLLGDERYIRVDDRPVLLVYRVDQIPEIERVVEVRRSYCRDNGIGDPYLVAVQSFAIDDPRPFGFDAAVEFPPHRTQPRPPDGGVQLLNPNYIGQVYDYRSLVPERVEWPAYELFKGIMPSWDNEARRSGRGTSFVGSEPGVYQQWLSKLCEATDSHHSDPARKMVFINAWNEWAEGAHLEPDRRYGYAFLQATADVLREYPQRTLELIEATQGERAEFAPRAVIINLYYDDLWEELAECLGNLDDFDLYMSVRPGIRMSVLADVLERYPGARLYAFPNRGRDIGPFFEILARVPIERYRFVCKIHTKKSLHRKDGDAWRRDLLGKLLGSRETVAKIERIFDGHPDVGLVGPEGHLVLGTTFWGSNEARVKEIAARMGMSAMPDSFSFFAGSMFWFRPAALMPLIQLGFRSHDFELEAGQVDGTLAHAIERLFPLAVKSAGFRQVDTSMETGLERDGADRYAFCGV